MDRLVGMATAMRRSPRVRAKTELSVASTAVSPTSVRTRSKRKSPTPAAEPANANKVSKTATQRPQRRRQHADNDGDGDQTDGAGTDALVGLSRPREQLKRIKPAEASGGVWSTAEVSTVRVTVLHPQLTLMLGCSQARGWRNLLSAGSRALG